MEIFKRPLEQSSRKLLADCGLPSSDIESSHFDNFLGCGTNKDLKGIVGLELFNSVALLRSLAVASASRGLGCAKVLVSEIESYAKENGVRELYLLTTTAEKYFSGLGYSYAERNTAPDEIKNTKEFSGLCPDSASFMVKKLED